MSRRLTVYARRGLVALCALAALLVSTAYAAHAQAPATEGVPPAFAPSGGALPVDGGVALVPVAEAVRPETLAESMQAAGCHLTSMALASAGRLVAYIAGAPPFVNAGFPSPVRAGSVLVVQCARPPLDTPDVHLLTPVTKEHALAPDLVPEDLVPLDAALVMPGAGAPLLLREAAQALREMLEAARAEGHTLAVRSAYRSHGEQTVTYRYWVALLGEAEASRRSARPGHSEHQLGTVVDLTSPGMGWELDPALGESPEGRWLSRHAWRFGFVESYPSDGEAVTGYAYEPWHLRYVGRTHASWLRATDLTLTEYLAALWGDTPR